MQAWLGLIVTLVMALGAGPGAMAFTEELYTTNTVCRQKYCVNPIVPGLDDLATNAKRRWQKQSVKLAKSSMEFCGNVTDYAFGVAVQDDGKLATSLLDQVRAQDAMAAKLYFYALSGMGLDAWDYQKPTLDATMPHHDCARTVARLACFTHFPSASYDVADGTQIAYLRPCRSSCENFLQVCNVECCDESVECVFQKDALDFRGGTGAMNTTQTGYIDAEGPSLACTGHAVRSGAFSLAAAAAMTVSASLFVA